MTTRSASTNGTPTRHSKALAAIVGQDVGLRVALARAATVAPTGVPVLVTGESGTGKELVARMLHELGDRPQGPFVTVNCGALARELAESELFGHERGAFTGAAGRRIGWFEEASGGTLVLDEVGELPLDLQPKLLRALETGRIRRVGGQGETPVAVRVVASTLRDLAADAREGRFRLDLFHRLAGIELRLPPLRRRPGDVAMLAGHFLREAVADFGPRQIDPEAIAALEGYPWPGNVRELRNVIRRAALLTATTIDAAALELPGSAMSPRLAETSAATAESPRMADAPANASRGVATGAPRPDATPIGVDRPDVVAILGRSLAEIERDVYTKTLRHTRGNRRAAARSLDISRSTFYERIKRLGITAAPWESPSASSSDRLDEDRH